MHMRPYSPVLLSANNIGPVLPESGRIFIDGIDISTVDTQALRSRVVRYPSPYPHPSPPNQAHTHFSKPNTDLPSPRTPPLPWQPTSKPRPAEPTQRPRMRGRPIQDLGPKPQPQHQHPPRRQTVESLHPNRHSRPQPKPRPTPAYRPRESRPSKESRHHPR